MMMDFWKEFWKKYRHLVPVAVYMIFYMSVFTYVENRTGVRLHLLSSRYDRLIPFCELFIIPYFMWFFYVAAGVLYVGIREQERRQYYLLITNLSIGMTLFLVISLLWPNGHTLRPATFSRDNIFTDMVRGLYLTDTSTNVFPSIHVFNSIAIHTTVAKCESLRKHPVIVRGSLILCILIIASTLFLKQHTIVDVLGAFVLNFATYHLVYQPKLQAQNAHSRYRRNHLFYRK